MYEFEVIGNIVGKQRPRVNMYTGNVYTPNNTKDYEEYIRQCFFLKYPQNEMLFERVKIDIVAYCLKKMKRVSSLHHSLYTDSTRLSQYCLEKLLSCFMISFFKASSSLYSSSGYTLTFSSPLST